MSEVIRNQRIHELADLLDETCLRMAATFHFTLFPTQVQESKLKVAEIQDTAKPLVNFLLEGLNGVEMSLDDEQGNKVGSIVLATWLGIDSSNMQFHHWITRKPETGLPRFAQQGARLHIGETILEMRQNYPIT